MSTPLLLTGSVGFELASRALSYAPRHTPSWRGLPLDALAPLRHRRPPCYDAGDFILSAGSLICGSRAADSVLPTGSCASPMCCFLPHFSRQWCIFWVVCMPFLLSYAADDGCICCAIRLDGILARLLRNPIVTGLSVRLCSVYICQRSAWLWWTYGARCAVTGPPPPGGR